MVWSRFRLLFTYSTSGLFTHWSTQLCGKGWFNKNWRAERMICQEDGKPSKKPEEPNRSFPSAENLSFLDRISQWIIISYQKMYTEFWKKEWLKWFRPAIPHSTFPLYYALETNDATFLFYYINQTLGICWYFHEFSFDRKTKKNS